MVVKHYSIPFLLAVLQFISPLDAAPASSSSFPECNTNINANAQAVKDAFTNAYEGYRRYAWGHDELLPVSKSYNDDLNHWGASIVDSLDTMIMMGLDDYYDEALNVFVPKINFKSSSDPAKGFETNIRYFGGLLAANDLRPNPILVEKAVELADNVLMPLFSSPSGAPYTFMDLASGTPQKTSTINLAEFGTYTLEFNRLSQVTGNDTYAKTANSLIDRAIAEPTPMPGLFPTSWNVNTFKPDNASIITVGAGGDSFYEYLNKNYMLLGGSDSKLMETWTNSVNSIQKYLHSPTQEDPNVQFVATITNSTFSYSSDELICFWPGNILLGTKLMNGETTQFEQFAQTFMDSCLAVWDGTATGIAPEAWTWNPESLISEKKAVKDSGLLNFIKDIITQTKKDTNDQRPFQITSPIYNLRPETIESVFYFYRITGDTKYQDIAWKLFTDIYKYTKTPSGGYTRLSDVDSVPPPKADFQESFFLAETLKYLYLTFVDKSCISLDNYVFNTEAHPFKLPNPMQVQS